MANVWFAGIQALGVVPKNGNPGRFANAKQVDRYSRVTTKPWKLTPNLISAGAPTLAGTEITDYFGPGDPAVLNDGALDGYTNDHNTLFTATYTLNTTRSRRATTSRDPHRCRSALADNGDQQAGQAWELWYSTADAPDTFKSRGAFHHISVNKAERASQIDLTASTASP